MRSGGVMISNSVMISKLEYQPSGQRLLPRKGLYKFPFLILIL